MNSNTCCFCNLPESVEHFFFNCCYSAEIWQSVLHILKVNRSAADFSSELNMAVKYRGFILEPTGDVVRVKSMSRGVPIHFVGKMARMKKESRERDRKKSKEARAG